MSSISSPPTDLLQLVSREGKEVAVERSHALVCGLIRVALEGDAEATHIPIPLVTERSLGKVVAFLQHHKGEEPPLPAKPLGKKKVMREVCQDPWDADFIDAVGEERQDLYDLLLAANYLDLKSLLHIGCAKVASLVKGAPLEKIPDILKKSTKPKPKIETSTEANSCMTSPSTAM